MNVPLSPVGLSRTRAAPSYAEHVAELSSDVRAFRLTSFALHWRLLLACVLLSVGLGAVYGIMKPDRYTAYAAILVGPPSADNDVIAARGDAQLTEATLLRLAALAARLDAEVQGLTEIRFPRGLEESTDPQMRSILDGERLIFAAGRRVLGENLEKLRHEQSLLEQRVGSLQEQVRLSEVELATVNEELGGVESLVSKKLAPAPRLLDLRRAGAVIASRKVELESELLSVRQQIAQIEQRMAEVRNKRESDALDKRQQVVAEITEASARRRTADQIARKFGNEGLAAGIVANEIDIIRSDALLDSVVRQLSLDQSSEPKQRGLPTEGGVATNLNPFEWLRDSGSGPEDLTAEGRIALATARLQENLGVKHEGAGSRVTIGFTSTNPDEAAQVPDAIARTYLAARSQGDEGEPMLDPAALNGVGNAAGRFDQLISTARTPPGPDGPGLGMILAAAAVLGVLLGTGLVVLTEIAKAFRIQPPQGRLAARPI
jgi:uncharacterized protein involved in exopolysaccharide biosynthesis